MKQVAMCYDGGNGCEIQTGSIKIAVRLFDVLITGEDGMVLRHTKPPGIVWGSISLIQVRWYRFVERVSQKPFLP